MFDRFRQADSTTTRVHGGVGLGLSIARQLVEAHQGTIEVESEGKNSGSTFTVRLPVAVQHDSVDSDAAPEAKTPSGIRLDGIRVLVVDDELDSREVMAHTLEDCGASVSLAGNAREALEILERAEMDVLLADISMPDQDGYS